jgi:MFS transporter, PCFT/HCP family, solute carrier family 46 (folate transporter), member 1
MTRESFDSIETAPLLGAAHLNGQDVQNGVNGHSGAALKSPRRRWWTRFQAKKPRTIVVLASTVKFLMTLSGTMVMLPIFRLMEDAFCHKYYDDESRDIIDEKKCKVDEIQKEMAYLFGFFALLNSVLGLLVTMPYGILADR